MVNPYQLISSRIQLHYAIQFMAAIANTFAPPQPDGSHVTLSWDAKKRLFVGIPISEMFQAALDPIGFNALFLDLRGDQIAMLSLDGQTLNATLEWHRAEITKLGLDASKVVFLDYPPDDFPDHRVAHGGAFEFEPLGDRIWLINYFQVSQSLLQNMISRSEKASELYIWPHHFDMATLLSLPTNNEEDSRTIGVGFSPGDATYPEPYWYVSPWPYPDPANLPTLAGGCWHTEGWIGVVLQASQIGDVETEVVQREIQAFLSEAISTSRQLLNR